MSRWGATFDSTLTYLSSAITNVLSFDKQEVPRGNFGTPRGSNSECNQDESHHVVAREDRLRSKARIKACRQKRDSNAQLEHLKSALPRILDAASLVFVLMTYKSAGSSNHSNHRVGWLWLGASLMFASVSSSLSQPNQSRSSKTLRNNSSSADGSKGPDEHLPRCVVCLSEPRCIVLADCNHLVTCNQCVTRMLEDDEHGPCCPICRKPIATLPIRVFCS